VTSATAWTHKCELAELIAVLGAAVDRRDKEAIAACYTVDSYDDHGSFKGSGQEFAEFICAPSNPGAQMTMHHMLGQSVFDVEDDEAWGETYFIMHAVIGGATVSAFGRYVDYFRRIDGTWRVVYRRVVADSTFPGDDGGYWKSSSDRTDPRYDRLTAPPD
jgi:hypothetical protein